MSEISFGLKKNDKICSCGRHYGAESITPEERAARAKRMEEKLPMYMTEDQINFLKDFEKYHGIVRYRMEIVGVNSGQYCKEEKGKDVIGPVYIDTKIDDDLFSARADING